METARRFNQKHRVGERCRVILPSGEVRTTTLCAEATIITGRFPVAYVSGVPAPVRLSRITMLGDAP
jgi:hypothetical protein